MHAGFHDAPSLGNLIALILVRLRLAAVVEAVLLALEEANRNAAYLGQHVLANARLRRALAVSLSLHVEVVEQVPVVVSDLCSNSSSSLRIVFISVLTVSSLSLRSSSLALLCFWSMLCSTKMSSE